MACVRDYAEKTMALYIDGAEVARTTNVGTGAIADNNEPFRIAISDEASRPYEGALDELTIRPVALAADDIKAIYDTYAAAGIAETVVTPTANRCMLVDAFTGRIIASAKGDNVAALMDCAVAGVYVVIIERTGSFETYKYVKH